MIRVTIGDDSLQKLSLVLFSIQSWLNMAALKFWFVSWNLKP